MGGIERGRRRKCLTDVTGTLLGFYSSAQAQAPISWPSPSHLSVLIVIDSATDIPPTSLTVGPPDAPFAATSSPPPRKCRIAFVSEFHGRWLPVGVPCLSPGKNIS